MTVYGLRHIAPTSPNISMLQIFLGYQEDILMESSLD